MASSSNSPGLTCLLRTRSARPTASCLPYSVNAISAPVVMPDCKPPPRSAEDILIDDILPDRFAVERAQNVARGLLAHAVDGLARHARHVRRHDDIGEFEQRMTARRRLLLENVEAGAGKLAGHQRVIQRLLL